MASDHKLSLAVVSQQVQLEWSLKILAQLIKVPKKHLRKAFKIISASRREAEIMEKGKSLKRTFHYGFRKFFIKQRGGKKREILAPHPDVQKVFKAVKEWLDRTVSPHKNAFGFVKQRNHKKAVEALLGKRHYFAFDISSAFPSIKIEMVEEALRKLGIDEVVVKVLAWLVTYHYQYQRRLPQGASSSPALLNLVYKPMCEEIDEICRKHKISWIVYADDFNFAAEEISPETKEELLAVPAKYGFEIKEKKTRDNSGRTIPHLLGLTIVNGQIHLRRGRKKEFRRIIYAALVYQAYSSEKVKGIIEAIRFVYGEENNWPGWLLRIWQDYQAEMEV